jgi:hypothetical protein
MRISLTMLRRRVLVLAWLITLAASATATEFRIRSVWPPSVSEGTELVIQGEDIASRPLVSLVSRATKRAIKLRVYSFSPDSIRARVGRVEEGAYDLCVRIRSSSQVLPAAVVVEGPRASSMFVSRGLPGALNIIQGAYFGERRGRVLFRLRDSTWSMRAAVRVWSDAAIVFEVPAVPFGHYDISIENRVGVTRVEGFVVGPQSSCFDADVSALIGGTLFVSEPSLSSYRRYLPTMFSVYGTRTLPSFRSEGLEFAFQCNVRLASFPIDVSRTPSAMVMFSTGRLLGPTEGIWRADAAVGTLSIELLSWSSGRLRGRMSATLVRVWGTGPSELRLENGEFELCLEEAR